jgi:hypothetical protein
MERNVPVQEGFRKKKYLRERTYSGPKYQWRASPVGRTAIILIGMIGDSLVERSGSLTRDFAKQGASQIALWTKFVALCPNFPKFYEDDRGHEYPLTPRIVGHRYHKMYYDHDGPPGTGRPGTSEHYMNNPRLRPYVPAVDVLFRRGKPLTIEEMRKAGS